MDIQLRRILKQLYPSRSGNGRHRNDAAERPFFGRFVDRRLKRAGTRFKHINKKRLLLTLFLVLVAIKVWGLLYYYNKFLRLQSGVAGARSQIIVQLQCRKDIVAELNTVVLAYAKHEKEIFDHALDTRKEIMHPSPETSKEASPSGLRLPIPTGDAALPKILAVAEGFPGLRLSENYQRLMDALVEVETKLAEKRMLLNASCNAMDTELVLFPGFIFNWTLRFEAPLYYVPDEDVQVPIRLDGTLASLKEARPVESHGEGGHD